MHRIQRATATRLQRFAILLALAALASAQALLAGPRDGGSRLPAQPTAVSWLDTPWTYRMSLTVDPDSLGAGTLFNFPVALHLGPAQAHVFDHSRADGGDLRVTGPDGMTPLPVEVVGFDPGTSSAEIWFEADSLSKTRNTFYLYYGNDQAGPPVQDGSVWNSDYVAVYHFAEDPGAGTLRDYTSNHADASSAWASAAWTSSDTTRGVLGQAWNFNGTTHWVDGDAIGTQDSSYVISAWLRLPTHTTDFTFQANPGYWHISAQINETHRRPHFNAANPWRDLRWDPNPLPEDDGYFHYFTWVFDGVQDTILFYYDGIQQPATPWGIDPGQHFYTGNPINPTKSGPDGVGVAGPMSWNSMDLMDGPVDEFRVSERTHSSDWIRTEYRNLRAPDTFFAFGAPEMNGVVPVQILYFTAGRTDDGAVLRWEAADPAAAAGFQVFRGDSPGTRTRLDAEPVAGPGVLTFLDPEPPATETFYWLAALSRNGGSTWFGPAQLPALTAGSPALRLGQNRPNPFRAETRIAFSTPEETRVRLRVFDLEGREVATLLDRVLSAGDHEATWDGRDAQGRSAPPGIYFYRLENGTETLNRRLLRLP